MSRLRGGLAGILSTPGPTVGVEIGSTHVSAVALTWAKTAPQITRFARAALPEGAVVPSPTASNLLNAGAVTEGIRKVLGVLPRRPTRVGLTLPDAAAKVSFVKFDSVPSRSADLERLIAWQVRRSAPFGIEEAQLAYTPGVRTPDGGQEFIVVLIRRDIVEEYERACQAAGAHAGLVDLTSVNVVNAAITTSPATHADWLLVHLADGYCTLAIVRDQDLIFFRNRPTKNVDDLADLVHQTALYYQDRLSGRGLAQTVLVDNSNPGARAADAEDTVAAMLEERLATPVRRLGSTRAASVLGVKPGALDGLAGPVGLLLRAQRPAA